MKKISEVYPAGVHTIKLKRDEIQSSGSLFYKMETDTFEEVKSMILID